VVSVSCGWLDADAFLRKVDLLLLPATCEELYDYVLYFRSALSIDLNSSFLQTFVPGTFSFCAFLP
jgi:hypothetical protein